MFLSQMRAFIMHWLLQLDFSAPKKKKKKKKKTKKNKKWERKWDCPRAEHWRFLDCCRLMDVVAKVFSYIWSGNQGEGRCIYWIGLTYIMGDVGLGSVEPTGHLSFWEMKSTIYLPKIEECELLCYLESIHSLLWWLNFCWLALL